MISSLSLLQIIIAVILIVLILLQQRGTALGSSFGQEGGFYATQRGLQKKILWATIILGAIFIILSLLNLIF
ncbi:MAG: preprotein translocase subunit SecG [Minisyncoccales bacterium]